MTSHLPYDFRVLRHVDRIYARDLPVSLCFSVATAPTATAAEYAGSREGHVSSASWSSPDHTNASVAFHHAPSTSMSSSRSASSTSSSSSPSSQGTPLMRSDPQRPHASQAKNPRRAKTRRAPTSLTHDMHRDPDAFFVLRWAGAACVPDADSCSPAHTVPGDIFYVSEVCAQSRQPTWRRLPDYVKTNENDNSPSLIWWELYYTPSCLADAQLPTTLRAHIDAHIATIRLPISMKTRRGVLVQRVCMPLSALLFLGTEVSVVDAQLPPSSLDTALVPAAASSAPGSPSGQTHPQGHQPPSTVSAAAATTTSAVHWTCLPLPFHLLLECVDGVFSYSPAAAQKVLNTTRTTQPAHSVDRTPSSSLSGVGVGAGSIPKGIVHHRSPSSSSPTPTSVPWLRSPAGESPYLTTAMTARTGPTSRTSASSGSSSPAPPITHVVRPPAMTTGDLKLMTTASTAWQHLLHIGQARRQGALDTLDARAEATDASRQANAHVATLQQAISDEQEALTLQTLRVEALRRLVAERESQVQQWQMQADALAARHATHNVTVCDSAQDRASETREAHKETNATAPLVPPHDDASIVARQELRRAEVRATLGDARRRHLQVLRELFPVELVSDRAYASAAYRATRRAKDKIGGCALPIAVITSSRINYTSQRSFTADAENGGATVSAATTRGLPQRSNAAHEDREGLIFSHDTNASINAGGRGPVGAVPRRALQLTTCARLSFPASTVEDAREEALALCSVAHALTLMAVLYGCPLPHPVLLAGVRSRVLVRADARPADVAPPTSSTGAMMLSAGAAVLLPTPSVLTRTTAETVEVPQHSLPFFVSCATDQPLVAAAVQLLRRDALVVADRMGLSFAVESCGLRLGAIVHILLNG